MKSTLKCADLFTASFEDGTLMTGTLNQLYEAQNNRKMTIKPVVWLWRSDSGLYMVDYILEGAGCLKCFTCEVKCKALGDDGKQYNAVWCPDCGQIYYTIPVKVKVLGYIPQYKEG